MLNCCLARNEKSIIEGRTVFIKRNAQRVQRTLGGTRVLVKDPKHRYKNESVRTGC